MNDDTICQIKDEIVDLSGLTRLARKMSRKMVKPQSFGRYLCDAKYFQCHIFAKNADHDHQILFETSIYTYSLVIAI